jgi:hypothetical protein
MLLFGASIPCVQQVQLKGRKCYMQVCAKAKKCPFTCNTMAVCFDFDFAFAQALHFLVRLVGVSFAPSPFVHCTAIGFLVINNLPSCIAHAQTCLNIMHAAWACRMPHAHGPQAHAQGRWRGDPRRLPPHGQGRQAWANDYAVQP